MTPAEWWRVYEVRRPRDSRYDYAGGLTEDEVAELYDLLED